MCFPQTSHMAPGSTKGKKKRFNFFACTRKIHSPALRVNTFKLASSCWFFFFLFFNTYFFSSSVSSIVIWLHQLNISHHVGFAPVFARYHTNTKMLLSDALIFQASQLGSLCWIPQWLLIKMLKQTNTHRGRSDHMWAWNSKVRSQLWDIEHQRFDVSPADCYIFIDISPGNIYKKKKKRRKRKKAVRKHFIMISEDDRIVFHNKLLLWNSAVSLRPVCSMFLSLSTDDWWHKIKFFFRWWKMFPLKASVNALQKTLTAG